MTARLPLSHREREGAKRQGEGSNDETFSAYCPHPAFFLRLRPIGLALRAATLSRWERALPEILRGAPLQLRSTNSFTSCFTVRLLLIPGKAGGHRPPLQGLTGALPTAALCRHDAPGLRPTWRLKR